MTAAGWEACWMGSLLPIHCAARFLWRRPYSEARGVVRQGRFWGRGQEEAVGEGERRVDVHDDGADPGIPARAALIVTLLLTRTALRFGKRKQV